MQPIELEKRKLNDVVMDVLVLSRRRGHLHARALQIRAVLSTHIHTEQGFEFGLGFSIRKRPTHSRTGTARKL